MIEPFKINDLQKCIEVFIKTYNQSPWNNIWTSEIAEIYLQELISFNRFVGFTLSENNEIIGAAFCREKTWWNNEELYIEEFFVSPDFQRKGYGIALLKSIQNYAKGKGLNTICLLTDRNKPAFDFYRKNELKKLDQIVFMYINLSN